MGEDEAFRRSAEWESAADKVLLSGGEDAHEKALEMLTASSNAHAEEVLREWWQFSTEIFTKFGRLVVTYNESRNGVDNAAQAKPEWWLSSPEVGYTSWSPQGPYHGIPLRGEPALIDPASMVVPAVPFTLESSRRLRSTDGGMVQGMLQKASNFLLPACVTVASVVSYQAGVRRGRQNFDESKTGLALDA